jgi:hypothetical protein
VACAAFAALNTSLAVLCLSPGSAHLAMMLTISADDDALNRGRKYFVVITAPLKVELMLARINASLASMVDPGNHSDALFISTSMYGVSSPVRAA